MSNSRKGIRPSAESNRKNSETHKRLKSYLRLRKPGEPPWNKGVKRDKPEGAEIRLKKSLALKAIGHRPPLIKGEAHYNWKGGITPEKNRIRASLEYKQWRNAVFLRDDWTCQKCKIRGGNIVAHHIESFHGSVDLRMVVSNGITLCLEHHLMFHNTYGQKNNTADQLNSFLGMNPKPTVEELEAILNNPEPLDIEVQSDGSIRAVPEGTAKNAEVKIITAHYAAAEFY